MLRFDHRPDRVFQAIVHDALEFVADLLEDEYCDLDGIGLESLTIFGKDGLVKQIRRLLEAHRSPKVFMPTDYHFLILFEVLAPSHAIDIVDEDLDLGSDQEGFELVTVEVDVLDAHLLDIGGTVRVDALQEVSNLESPVESLFFSGDPLCRSPRPRRQRPDPACNGRLDP